MSGAGRLAPTPSGHLHLGNICAFAAAWLASRHDNIPLLLRVEDLDRQRSDPNIAAAHRTEFLWLELDWDHEVPPQATRDYSPWLGLLEPHIYHCQCTRRMLNASNGSCDCYAANHTSGSTRFRLPNREIHFHDVRWGHQTDRPGQHQDPILVRRDGAVNYTLAVVADDIQDGISQVVRGVDLLTATGTQVALWNALGATPPQWIHTPLIVGPDGRKLSKSHGSLEVRALRRAGWHPQHIWHLVLQWLGCPGATSLAEALDQWDPTNSLSGPISLAWSSTGPPGPQELTWYERDHEE